ncbi:MAG: FolB domain-containing protein [Sulfurovum sp.]|nr:FolB domain-containing protein [Sulfurovum sp.]
MTIHIEDLTFDVIIGLLDFERDRPQNVIVNLVCDYDYAEDNFINYADIVEHLENKLKSEQYELLENALLGLKDLLRETYPQIQSLKIKIAKPDILPQCTVALSKSWHF